MFLTSWLAVLSISYIMHWFIYINANLKETEEEASEYIIANSGLVITLDIFTFVSTIMTIIAAYKYFAGTLL